MLRYVRRGGDVMQPLGDYPQWLAALLRTRGVDTVEKAERFLHPTLEQLHDPFLMQGMDKAVELIRAAVQRQEKIVIYGDYDVDGVCATTILMETLGDMGANVAFRIPSRHEEGYGLNCDAVRAMAQEYKLLITVDCGVTNHEEVKLAQMLGMTVIVTDHHQLADTPSPADAVLNPLLGDYPFRRLCGAGVALKVCQALSGVEAVRKRLDVAALATVADIVPLIDENRVIVREGLAMMGSAERIGLKMLMAVSGVEAPVNAGHVGFRLAPRLNAGGRLEDASQGVKLLLTHDREEAERIATHLEQNNQMRQAIESEIENQAREMMRRDVDFLTDKVIVVMGENWNSGVIGLTAGRICERMHFPTIVLSKQGDMAVGSCRSIPGVNIHAMLCTCKDLFERFGGHEQAAGLTMRADLVPELRRRMNLAITENCDAACYVPEKEYDLALSLSQVNLPLIERLEQLQPTGYGNPAPVFLCQGAHVQEMRRVGRDSSHLKLTVLENGALRSGIGFSMGDFAEQGIERADILFTPEKNEFRGYVSPQLAVKALKPAEGSAPMPDGEAFFRSVLQEITHLAENFNTIQVVDQPIDILNETAVRKLLRQGRGTLLIAHEPDRASSFAVEGAADVCCGSVTDERAFNTILCGVDVTKLSDVWQDIVLLDGDLLPGEAAAIRARCPRAKLHRMQDNPKVAALLQSLRIDDAAWRRLYIALRAGQTQLSAIAEAAGMTRAQVLTGLVAFQQVDLVEVSLDPYAVCLLPKPAEKRNLNESALIRWLRAE